MSQDLQSVAFPTLGDAALDELGRCSEAPRVRYRDGETLFEAGQREYPFHVVISGAVEVVDTTGTVPRRIALHERGQFTGDVAHLTGRPAVVSAIARGETEVFELSRASLRKLMNACPDVGDTIVQAFIARRQILLEPGRFTGFRVVGSRHSQDAFRVRDFLAKNRVPFTFLDLESHPDVAGLLHGFGYDVQDTPVVSFGSRLVMRNPTNAELAEVIGMRKPVAGALHDLVIVGAGPAGLAAAVYGASEGLDTVILDANAAGGQAARSMRIENYFGFPTGISGGELIDRGVLQAGRFGAVLSVPGGVTRLAFDGPTFVLDMEDGTRACSRSVIIASGIDYRRLPIEGCERFEGCGIYYAATFNELDGCRGAEVVVVGGGNSAGQAAVFLAQNGCRVHLVVRGDDLRKSMSAYLADRIEHVDDIEVHLRTTVVRISGTATIDEVELQEGPTGRTWTIRTPAVFSFIGAQPRTSWLPPEIAVDRHGFVLTGSALPASSDRADGRAPFLLETSRRGVFAAGDVRSGSAKRVASAVGEGAMSVKFIHEHLAGA